MDFVLSVMRSLWRAWAWYGCTGTWSDAQFQEFISTVWRMDGRGGKGIRPPGKLLL